MNNLYYITFILVATFLVSSCSLSQQQDAGSSLDPKKSDDYMNERPLNKGSSLIEKEHGNLKKALISRDEAYQLALKTLQKEGFHPANYLLISSSEKEDRWIFSFEGKDRERAPGQDHQVFVNKFDESTTLLKGE